MPTVPTVRDMMSWGRLDVSDGDMTDNTRFGTNFDKDRTYTYVLSERKYHPNRTDGTKNGFAFEVTRAGTNHEYLFTPSITIRGNDAQYLPDYVRSALGPDSSKWTLTSISKDDFDEQDRAPDGFGAITLRFTDPH